MSKKWYFVRQVGGTGRKKLKVSYGRRKPRDRARKPYYRLNFMRAFNI